jgi:hypothetical protein
MIGLLLARAGNEPIGHERKGEPMVPIAVFTGEMPTDNELTTVLLRFSDLLQALHAGQLDPRVVARVLELSGTAVGCKDLWALLRYREIWQQLHDIEAVDEMEAECWRALFEYAQELSPDSRPDPVLPHPDSVASIGFAVHDQLFCNRSRLVGAIRLGPADLLTRLEARAKRMSAVVAETAGALDAETDAGEQVTRLKELCRAVIDAGRLVGWLAAYLRSHTAQTAA